MNAVNLLDDVGRSSLATLNGVHEISTGREAVPEKTKNNKIKV